MILEQTGCLRTEEGPIYDVIRLNTVACDSVMIDGVRFVNEDTRGDLGDLEEPIILHPALAALAGQPALGVRCKRKIPAKNLLEARTIMQIVYEKFGTEVMVFILYDKRTDEFITLVPKQEVTSVTCHVAAEDGSEGQTADIIMAADFHSHPFGGRSGFLSGTDHHNHDSYQSVPIASFNFDPKPKIGDLYRFGVLEAEYGNIPLRQSQFTEPVDEVFIIGEEDRARWTPIIEAKVKKPQTAVSSACSAWQRNTFGRTWYGEDDDEDYGWAYGKGFHGGETQESALLKKEDEPNIFIHGEKLVRETDRVDATELYDALAQLVFGKSCQAFGNACTLVEDAEAFIVEEVTSAPYLSIEDWPGNKQIEVDFMVDLLLGYSELKASDLDDDVLGAKLAEIESRFRDLRLCTESEYYEVAKYCPPVLVLALYAFGTGLSDGVALKCRARLLEFCRNKLGSQEKADTILEQKPESADEVSNVTQVKKQHDGAPSGE